MCSGPALEPDALRADSFLLNPTGKGMQAEPGSKMGMPVVCSFCAQSAQACTCDAGSFCSGRLRSERLARGEGGWRLSRGHVRAVKERCVLWVLPGASVADGCLG